MEERIAASSGACLLQASPDPEAGSLRWKSVSQPPPAHACCRLRLILKPGACGSPVTPLFGQREYGATWVP